MLHKATQHKHGLSIGLTSAKEKGMQALKTYTEYASKDRVCMSKQSQHQLNSSHGCKNCILEGCCQHPDCSEVSISVVPISSDQQMNIRSEAGTSRTDDQSPNSSKSG